MPLAVIIRFAGDPDDLLARFERVRRLWIEAQAPDYEPPVFYAACRSKEGLAILTGWDSAKAHRAFGQGLHTYIEAAGMPTPTGVERLRVETLGWDVGGAPRDLTY